jgi:hypothetical protein
MHKNLSLSTIIVAGIKSLREVGVAPNSSVFLMRRSTGSMPAETLSVREEALLRGTTETEVTHMFCQRDRSDWVPSPRSKKIRLPRFVYLESVAMRGIRK